MPQQEEFKDEGISAIDLLAVIVRHRWMIIIITILTCVITAIYSLFLPNIYMSTTKIILSSGKESSSISAIAAQLPGGLASIAGGALGIKDPGELSISMLKSKNITDKIITKFNLKEIYNVRYMSAARSIIESNVSFEIEKKTGILSINVEDTSPERAKDIANEYVNLLKDLNNKINLSSAKRERMFLEERIEIIDKDFKKAQEKLRLFQEENKAVNMSVQGEVVMQVGARIQGEIFASEVESKALETILSPDSARIRAIKEKIKELKKQLKLVEGKSRTFLNSDSFYPVISNIPSITLKYANLLRDVRIQETIFELLTKQYELAKIQEAKESSIMEVLDYAEIPEKNERIRPKRSNMVIMAGIISIFLSIILVFFKEGIKKLNERNPKYYEKINEIKKIIKNDFRFSKK